ncbi:hypothetical protein, partial [Bradyrhizobium elkanii]|uniref:hypothetical protein n=1 Tax=Bradyrhizobium elkanii TaxID=29448 RepID=UPI001AEC1B52
MNRLITTFDEVHTKIAQRFTSLATRPQSRGHGVTLFKTCTAEVFRPVPIGKTKVFKIETRKDSAVHVSLSSSSLVKQP